MIQKRINKIFSKDNFVNPAIIANTTMYHFRRLSKKFCKVYQLRFRVRQNLFSQIFIN